MNQYKEMDFNISLFNNSSQGFSQGFGNGIESSKKRSKDWLLRIEAVSEKVEGIKSFFGLFHISNDSLISMDNRKISYFSVYAVKSHKKGVAICDIHLNFSKRVRRSETMKMLNRLKATNQFKAILICIHTLRIKPRSLTFFNLFQEMKSSYYLTLESDRIFEPYFFGCPSGKRDRLAFQNFLSINCDFNENANKKNNIIDVIKNDSELQFQIEKRKKELFSLSVVSFFAMQNKINELDLREEEKNIIVSLTLSDHFFDVKSTVDNWLKEVVPESFVFFQQLVGFPSIGNSLARKTRRRITNIHSSNIMRLRDIVAMYYVIEQVIIKNKALNWVMFFDTIYSFSPNLYADYIQTRVVAEVYKKPQFKRNVPFQQRIKRQLKLFQEITNINVLK